MSCNKSANIFVLGLVSAMSSDIKSSNSDQQQVMTFAYVFSVMLLVVFGILSNVLSIDTFRQAQIRTTTVGFYLVVYSCCSIFGIFMLGCHLSRLLNSYSYTTSVFICKIVAGFSTIFTRICLWLNGFIALQRSIQSLEANPILDKIRSRSAAPIHVLVVIIIVTSMHIHELIYRVSVPDSSFQEHFVCQLKYPPSVLTLNTAFAFTHIIVPVSLNIFADFMILTSISNRKANLHRTTYRIQWMRQFRRHSHLFLAPTLTIICMLPQLTLSLLFSCVNVSLKWLLRLNISTNLIIYLPQTITFILFILPSSSYFEVFKTQSSLGKLFFRYYRSQNRIAPQIIMMNHLQKKTIED